MLKQALISAIFFSSLFPAFGASSNWIETPGGKIRIVTTGLSDHENILRGALQIELEQGWKTYGSDPGDAGIPPEIFFSAEADSKSVRMLFPLPKIFKDEHSSWAGYDSPVSFPLLITLAQPNSSGIVEGTISLGVCETICIPVHEDFSFDSSIELANSDDAMIVSQAFDAVPAKP